jgi:hypothetical protein
MNRVDQIAFEPGAVAATVNIALSSASQRVQFQTGNTSKHCRVVNSGTVIAFIEFGSVAVVAAAATGNPVLPNTEVIFSAPYPYAAAIGAAGSTVYFTPGEGLR